MNKQELTAKGKKITVLRGFKDNQWCVCQGDNWYGKGLQEKYAEFTDYQSAYEYFNLIQQ